MRRKLNWKFIRNLNNKSDCQLIYFFCIVLIVHCDKKELIYSTRSLTGRRIIIHYNVFSQILFQMNYWQSFHSTNAFEIKICDKIDGFVANREIVQIPTENNTNKLNNKSDIGRWSTFTVESIGRTRFIGIAANQLQRDSRERKTKFNSHKR